jgi:hypothetical protein
MCEQNGSLRQLLDVYHQSRIQGTHCKLFFETINGLQFCNLSVQIPVGSPTRKFAPATRIRKSPSTIRRDQARIKKWRLKKKESVLENPPTKSFIGSGLEDSVASTIGSGLEDSVASTKDDPPSTEQHSDPMTPIRRMATPSRKLATSGAGREVDGAVWQPCRVMEVSVVSPIPQYDGQGNCENYCEHSMELLDGYTEDYNCSGCKKESYFSDFFKCVQCQFRICDDCWDYHGLARQIPPND